MQTDIWALIDSCLDQTPKVTGSARAECEIKVRTVVLASIKSVVLDEFSHRRYFLKSGDQPMEVNTGGSVWLDLYRERAHLCPLTFAFCRAVCAAQRAEGVGQQRAVRRH